ncbi:MAG: ribonuclease P protein component [Rikenellaceae bacterium]
MEESFSLEHHERLRSRGSIRRLFESGKSGFVYPLRYMWFAEKGSEKGSEAAAEAGSAEAQSSQVEVLFTVPKRFHKRANRRNLLRRRVKESYRLQKASLLGRQGVSYNIDLALVYSTKDVRSYKTISHAVHKILENIASEL